MLKRFVCVPIILIIQFMALSGTFGCSTAKHGEGSRSPTAWEGRLQALFDDSIDPTSVGLSPSTSEPEDANEARGQAADLVARARLTTITLEGTDHSRRYSLVLRVVGEPILGPRPADGTINLTIGRIAPCFGLVQAREMQLSGAQFVAFVREFAEPDGTVVHWYLASDTPEVVAAARTGAALRRETD